MFKARLVWLCHVLLLSACTVPASKSDAPTRPQRIISVVPNVTEMLFAFGLGDKVIAVSDYDEFPQQVLTKPRVGALLNPNIEKIIELKPDLVITYGTQDVLRDRLQSVGIHMYPFVHGNVEHTLQFMLDLGRAVGTEARAAQVVQDIRNTFDEVRRQAPAVRPRVVLITYRGPGILGAFYTVGARAFQHDLIEMAGGSNLFGDVDSETLEPTLEEVISRKPDIIIETVPSREGAEVAQRKKDWERVGLGKGHVYVEADEFLMVPGPRFNLAARRFSEIIRGVR
jgi:cobalamin transport system substrate-binding protein